jgi:hypothetical protein
MWGNPSPKLNLTDNYLCHLEQVIESLSLLPPSRFTYFQMEIGVKKKKRKEVEERKGNRD